MPYLSIPKHLQYFVMVGIDAIQVDFDGLARQHHPSGRCHYRVILDVLGKGCLHVGRDLALP